MKIELVGHFREVLVNGEHLDPQPSQRLFNHSPDGFAWGYGGSGPAQLALALLLAGGATSTDAVEFHQAFKDDFVALWPQHGGAYDVDVDEWLFIQEAKRSFGDPSLHTLLDALDAYYLNGVPDQQSGNVDAPTGHFFRVDRWIVTTDSSGFKSIDRFDDEAAAQREFDVRDTAYAAWDDEEGVA